MVVEGPGVRQQSTAGHRGLARHEQQPEISPLLGHLARWCVDALGAETGIVWLLDGVSSRLEPVARHGQRRSGDSLQPGDDELALRAIETGAPVLFEEAGQDWATAHRRPSVMAAPVLAGTKKLGAITATAREQQIFSWQHLGLLNAAAQLAALALARAGEWATAAQERNALKAILFSMTEAVYSTDLEGRIVSFNPGAERLTGYAAYEVIGRHYIEALRVTDEAGQELDEGGCPLRGCIVSKRPAYVPVAFVSRRDGRRVPVALSTSPILDPLGGPAWCVAILRDLSAERDVEELKANLISLVSHELRTPLSHIKGFASMLRQPQAPLEEEIRRDFLGEIEGEADRLEHLIANLLDMSHIDAGGLRAQACEPVAPGALARAAVGQLRRELAARRVLVRAPAGLPCVMANAAQMERVLVNLLENAAKYSRPGGTIRLQARAWEQWVELSVADQGPGIPAEHRERIFEKFYRVQDGTIPCAPGTGLGLAICRAIVAAHGGTIHAESRPDRGTRFIVRLPAAPTGIW